MHFAIQNNIRNGKKKKFLQMINLLLALKKKQKQQHIKKL